MDLLWASKIDAMRTGVDRELTVKTNSFTCDFLNERGEVLSFWFTNSSWDGPAGNGRNLAIQRAKLQQDLPRPENAEEFLLLLANHLGYEMKKK